MKKVSYIVMVISAILLVVLNCAACAGDYRDKDKIENRSVTCQQPGSFFPEGEQRYILVDESTQMIGGIDSHCYIYADRYTHVMYGYYVSLPGSYSKTAVMIQLEYEDGSPMLYDNGEW